MSYLESLLPPAAGDRAQAIALKHLSVASKVALAWCALSAITGFTLGNTDAYVSLGRFVACAFGLMSVAQLLRHADQVKVDRQTYWLLIRRGIQFGLGLSFLTIVAVITADGLSPSLSGFVRGLASAWFITPASTCLIQGVMRYRYRQDERDSEVED